MHESNYMNWTLERKQKVLEVQLTRPKKNASQNESNNMIKRMIDV